MDLKNLRHNKILQTLRKPIRRINKKMLKKAAAPRVIVPVLGLCLMAASWLAGSGLSARANEKAVRQVDFQMQSKKQDDSAKSVYQYKANYAVGVQYPQFGMAGIDTHVKGRVDKLVQKFESKYKKRRVSSIHNRPVLSVDYRVSSYKDQLLSVTYFVNQEMPDEKQKKQDIVTEFYDQKQDKEIPAAELFDEGVLSFLTEQATAFFQNNPDFKKLTKSKQFLKHTKPDWGNYQGLSLSDEGVQVYFSAHNLFQEDQSPVVMTLGLDQIAAWMKAYYKQQPQIDPAKPMVALTFDDGPYPEVTNRILNCLETYQSRATFYVVGNRVERFADTIRRASDLGCQIGNHSFDHSNLTKIDLSAAQWQVSHTNGLIAAITGQQVFSLRPPYGAHNADVDASAGGSVSMWSVDSLDWKSKDAGQVIQMITSNVKDGDIVLMHDLYHSTADAAEWLIPNLIEQGYQLVTVDELIQSRRGEIVHGRSYYSVRP